MMRCVKSFTFHRKFEGLKLKIISFLKVIIFWILFNMKCFYFFVALLLCIFHYSLYSMDRFYS